MILKTAELERKNFKCNIIKKKGSTKKGRNERTAKKEKASMVVDGIDDDNGKNSHNYSQIAKIKKSKRKIEDKNKKNSMQK